MASGMTQPAEAAAMGAKGEDREVLVRLHKKLKRSKVADKRWRPRAEESQAFYHALNRAQWNKNDLAQLDADKRPAVTINRIKPTIRLIWGLVVSQPQDWIAKPIGLDDDDIAQAGTAALKQVARVNHTVDIDNAVYLDSLNYGVGWGMAGIYIRNPDRRTEPVQHRYLDPREVRWDPNSREADLTDCRWVVWSRKWDLDEAIEEYPEHAEALRKLVGIKDPNLDEEADDDSADGKGPTSDGTPPHSAWAGLDWLQMKEDGEVDRDNLQLVIHEAWERYRETAWLLEYVDGLVCEFDPKSAQDVAKLSSPRVKSYYQGPVFRLRYFHFAGNVLLHKAPSPYKHDRFPFVPCWGERDKHGDPISMVEILKDPQREINSRRSKELDLLTNEQVAIDEAVLRRMDMDIDEAAKHRAKGGAVWLAKQGEINPIPRPGNAAGQHALYQDAKEEMQFSTGANDEMMGYPGKTVSGKAKELQIGQGQLMLRPSESAFRAYRQLLGEITMQLIQQVHTDEWIVRIQDRVGKDKLITINKREIDPNTGAARVLNDINQARYELEIDAQPWTPTVRQRNADMINAMAESEPDPIVGHALRRLALQVSDIPEKSMVLEAFDAAIAEARATATAAAGGMLPPGAEDPAAMAGLPPEVPPGMPPGAPMETPLPTNPAPPEAGVLL